jgi:hypothetical protein
MGSLSSKLRVEAPGVSETLAPVCITTGVTFRQDAALEPHMSVTACNASSSARAADRSSAGTALMAGLSWSVMWL